MTRSAVATLGLLLLATACGSDNSGATTPSTTTTSPSPQTLTGLMAPNGFALRTFTASGSGSVTVTLTSTDPASTVVGLGIGVPSTLAGLCDFTTTVRTAAGTTPQITIAVDAGTYCAGAFDIGGVPSRGVVVSITITHP